MKMKVVQSGQLKPLKLTAEQYRQLGNAMLAAQKKRISRGINVKGQPAAPLSKKYQRIKRKTRGVSRPIRDMKLTGQTLNSFQIVRAYGGVIRAEPRSTEGKKRAWAAQLVRDTPGGPRRFEPMIGFTDAEEKAVQKQAREMFGRNTKVLWEKR